MKLKKRMSPKWGNIHLIQDKLEKKLKNHDKGFVDNLKMVSGELLENSVKYYMKNNIRKSINFTFYHDEEVIISIRDQWVLEEDIREITESIDKINNSRDPYGLFLERLQEILDNRVKGESRLGLLRIASEGGFTLSYKFNNGKLSITAQKKITKEEFGMLPLDYEDLKIEVTDFEEYIKVDWIGKCRTLNPESILDNYLAKLTQHAIGKKVFVSFDSLESMNSSTVPPLLTLIKTLEENKTESLILYNEDEDWQRASFKPLTVIASRYQYVKIKPSSSVKI